MTRGSHQFWQRRRASKILPRIRAKPSLKREARLANIVAYKVGMSNLMMIDDSESPAKQQEVNKACTVLEVPQMELYGIRFYRKNPYSGYLEVATEIYSKDAIKKFGIKTENNDTKLNKFKEELKKFQDATALIVAYPETTGSDQKHIERFESFVDAKNIEEKFLFLSNNLGKEIKIDSTFKQGEYIDVTAITKGKGWQGAIKRFGVSRHSHKATQKIRSGSILGSYGIGKILYTVPRPGQMGFNYRTERNKRILKIGNPEQVSEVNKKSGFINYGNVKNSFVIIEGSIPGTQKRLVRLRESLSRTINSKPREPKIITILK